MSARLLTHGEPGRFQKIVDKTLNGLANWYERRISSSLDYRPVTLLMVVSLLGATGFMLTNTSSELAPEEDQGALFALMNAPRYATLDYTQAFATEITNRTKDIEEVETYFSVAGMGTPNTGFYIWALKDWANRSRSQEEIKQQIQGVLDNAPGMQSFVFAPPSLPGAGGGLPISMVIQSIHAPNAWSKSRMRSTRRRWPAASSSSCRTRCRLTHPRCG